jgi:hypothetical protein
LLRREVLGVDRVRVSLGRVRRSRSRSRSKSCLWNGKGGRRKGGLGTAYILRCCEKQQISGGIDSTVLYCTVRKVQ